jgi:hypothetical protein
VAEVPAASPAAPSPLADGTTAFASVPNSLGGTDQPAVGGGSSPAADKADPPKASTAVEAPPRAESSTEQPVTKTEETTGSADAARVNSSSSPAPASELSVIAESGNGNGHAKNGAKTNGSKITLSLGTTNVAFKIQEDAPSCAECGSIMVRNGSCYKCLNCGSTSGCS